MMACHMLRNVILCACLSKSAACSSQSSPPPGAATVSSPSLPSLPQRTVPQHLVVLQLVSPTPGPVLAADCFEAWHQCGLRASCRISQELVSQISDPDPGQAGLPPHRRVLGSPVAASVDCVSGRTKGSFPAMFGTTRITVHQESEHGTVFLFFGNRCLGVVRGCRASST